MKNPGVSFGSYVKRRREALGKTLRAFASEIEISPAYLSDIENGHRYAPEKFLSRFISALEITETEEIYRLYDLAGVNKNGQHADINTYMDNVPTARVALRTAKDVNLSDDDWKKLIEIIKGKKHDQ